MSGAHILFWLVVLVLVIWFLSTVVFGAQFSSRRLRRERAACAAPEDNISAWDVDDLEAADTEAVTGGGFDGYYDDGYGYYGAPVVVDEVVPAPGAGLGYFGLGALAGSLLGGPRYYGYGRRYRRPYYGRYGGRGFERGRLGGARRAGGGGGHRR